MMYAALAIAFYLGGVVCSWGFFRLSSDDDPDDWDAMDVLAWPYYFVRDLLDD